MVSFSFTLSSVYGIAMLITLVVLNSAFSVLQEATSVYTTLGITTAQSANALTFALSAISSLPIAIGIGWVIYNYAAAANSAKARYATPPSSFRFAGFTLIAMQVTIAMLILVGGVMIDNVEDATMNPEKPIAEISSEWQEIQEDGFTYSVNLFFGMLYLFDAFAYFLALMIILGFTSGGSEYASRGYYG